MEDGLGFCLATAPFLCNGKSRSISAENPNGEKGGGGKAAGDLGPGRKGRPCVNLAKNAIVELAAIKGPGVIRHIWFTVTDSTPFGNFVLRDLVLRMYWEEEQNPSVETPLGDFFCNGFGTRCRVNSLPITVNPSGGMNAFFPMPFRHSARITIENQHDSDIEGFFYQIDYMLLEAIPARTANFHAQWRRENPACEKKDYTILDGVSGKGHFVGVYLAWAALSRYWWGEGEMKFYIDGDREWPTICGTGAEDYFGGAWCFCDKQGEKMAVQTYNTPFMGYPFCSSADDNGISYFGKEAVSVPMHGMYRWHLMDTVCFDSDLKVTIQQIGHNGRELFERSDDISSVAYWYQTEPHSDFPVLPTAQKRRPR